MCMLCLVFHLHPFAVRSLPSMPGASMDRSDYGQPTLDRSDYGHKILIKNMKRSIITTLLLVAIATATLAQQKQNPVIKNFGGIYDIPDATLLPQKDLAYKVVIDLYSGADSPENLNPALNNVARMMNLHAIGGAEKPMEVVLAIHGKAYNLVMNNQAYQDRFGVDNPNIDLVRELKQAGVKLAVCGQSLLARKVEPSQLLPEIELATSMLTTVTTYQLQGYAFLAF